jgi:photosystem I P700 chlorophyll a apoprotein A1
MPTLHDFDSHTSDLEDISRKIFSAHFGHLAVIFIWLSGMYFHGAKFSNYEAGWPTPPASSPVLRWFGPSLAKKF